MQWEHLQKIRYVAKQCIDNPHTKTPSLHQALAKELRYYCNTLSALECFGATQLYLDFVEARVEIEKRQGNAGHIDALEDAPKVFKCVDAFLAAPIPIADTRFKFIADRQIAEILERDMIEASDCLKTGRYKACMVLCGSILEAALYELLRRNEAWTNDPTKSDHKYFTTNKIKARDIKSNDVKDKWTLHVLIEFCCDNNLVDKRWRSTLHNHVQEQRNLVHATVELRTKYAAITPQNAKLCYTSLDGVLLELQTVKMPP